MKVFHLVSNKEWGGGEQYVYDLCQRQMADGLSVSVFCRPGPVTWWNRDLVASLI